MVNLGDFIEHLSPVIKKVPTEEELLINATNGPSIPSVNTTVNTAKTVADINNTTSTSPWAKIKEKVNTNPYPNAQQPGILRPNTPSLPQANGYIPTRRPMPRAPMPNISQPPRPTGRIITPTHNVNPAFNSTVGIRRTPIGRRPVGPQAQPRQQETYVNPYLSNRGY